eukprot:TRINITY_DN8443_c0_g1_i2.p1 TRINITY_DN8443_c0_g1~~TRINITY_DN8443_c0_g1_i2.p1  ORF type:complete len:572 (+),score=60.98 TRINITY_DN8443_c0_g1_i2:98-1813(+)
MDDFDDEAFQFWQQELAEVEQLPPSLEEIEAADRNTQIPSVPPPAPEVAADAAPKRVLRRRASSDAPLPKSQGRVQILTTPVETAADKDPLSVDAPVEAEEEPPVVLTRKQRDYFYQQARAFYITSNKKAKKTKEKYDAFRSRMHTQFNKLSNAALRRVASDMVKSGKFRGSMDTFQHHPLLADAKAARKPKLPVETVFFQGRCGIFTYYSKDWVWPAPADKSIPWQGLADVTEHIVSSSKWTELAPKLGQAIGTMISGVNAVRYSWAFEVCPRSWENSRVARGHIHIALDWRTKQYQRKRDVFAIGGVAPIHARVEAERLSRKARSSAAAHYHFCFFVVSQRACSWRHRNSKHVEEWIAMGVGVSRHLHDMKTVEARQKEASLAERIAAFHEQVALMRKPAVYVPKVEERWKPQFEAVKDRYKFLVLWGPSKYGKTQYAFGLFGKRRTLYADCSQSQHPDLRDWDPMIQRCIILDEIKLPAAMALKRLIQAPADPVQMGTTATQQWSYRVWVARTGFVLTSNTFRSEFEKLPKEDQDWIRRNAIVVHVTDYLYERDGAESEEEQVFSPID